jgi:hypothetical protein
LTVKKMRQKSKFHGMEGITGPNSQLHPTSFNPNLVPTVTGDVPLVVPTIVLDQNVLVAPTVVEGVFNPNFNPNITQEVQMIPNVGPVLVSVEQAQMNPIVVNEPSMTVETQVTQVVELSPAEMQRVAVEEHKPIEQVSEVPIELTRTLDVQQGVIHDLAPNEIQPVQEVNPEVLHVEPISVDVHVDEVGGEIPKIETQGPIVQENTTEVHVEHHEVPVTIDRVTEVKEVSHEVSVTVGQTIETVVVLHQEELAGSVTESVQNIDNVNLQEVAPQVVTVNVTVDVIPEVPSTDFVEPVHKVESNVPQEHFEIALAESVQQESNIKTETAPTTVLHVIESDDTSLEKEHQVTEVVETHPQVIQE